MLRKRSFLGALLLCVALFVLSACGGEKTAVPNRPSHGNISDAADILSSDEEKKLNELIDRRNNDGDGARVAIVTVDGVDGDWEDWTKDTASHWGVGDHGKDNGALIAVDMKDRHTRIEVADGLKKTFTDDDAQTVLDDILDPGLKDDHPSQALTDTTTAIYDDANGVHAVGSDRGFWARNYGWFIAGGLVLMAAVVVLWAIRRERKIRKGADREIAEYERSHPGEKVTKEQRQAFRKYRSYHRHQPADFEERERRKEEARREGRELDPEDDPEVTTQYAPTFAAWLPLYVGSPEMYSGAGSSPGSYSSSGSSFGGGGGFSGGGASGSF
ncbi:TPM domain-containing protein [Kocuria massiliensis]|uniref:TPM domain-containing protein n=1 Tax=Kocuria massiliensis TaxID=1926282 RepID=UPI000A1CCA4A|nr:TPM domain-containing protein [Kocuria massiliensis]